MDTKHELPASPFEAPWILPRWHKNIVIEPAPETCRIAGRVLVGPCWCWCGWNNGKGHGVVRLNGQRHYLHRLSLAGFLGVEVSKLDTVDHLCRRRNCFNPLHVEDTTYLENYLRGDGPSVQFKTAEEYTAHISDDDMDALARGY